jgi:uncharacterized protein
VSPFVFNVADLLGRSGATRPERIATAVDWHLDASRVAAQPPLEADLVLQAVPSGILVRGNISFRARNTCQRCLDEFDEDRSVAVASLFEREPEDAGYGIEADTIDVEQMLIDETLLALPVFPVCGDACEGVVTKPESDLNTGPSGDDRGSPFAVLKDLFDPED